MSSPAGSAQGFLAAGGRPVPPVDPSTVGLSLATTADASRFLIQGRYASVFGDQRRPGGTVDLFGFGRAEGFRTGAGRAANVVLFPGMCRRDFVGRDGTYVETTVVAPELPLVVIQWNGEGSPTGSVDFRIRLHADDPSPSVTRSGEAFAVVSGDRGVAVRTDPARNLTLEPEGPSTFRVSVASGGGRSLSLVLAGGKSKQLAAALSAASHLPGHAMRAAEGPCPEGLSLSLGVPEIDDAFSWAKARLRGRIDQLAATPPGPVPAAVALELGLAAAAVGDRDGSARVLAFPGLTGTAQEAILAARHASTFGETRRAEEVARRRLDDPETAGKDVDLWRLADQALSDGLLYTASEETRRVLRGLVGAARGGPRSLPVIGGTQEPAPGGGEATAIRALLEGEPVLAGTTGTDGPTGEARRLAAAFRRSPTEAWLSWRQLTAGGLEHGPDGPATWVDGVAGSTTAALLLALTQGMLGMAPDAPAGRLRLAPRLPEHVSRFAVDGITLGDATATLRYQRSDRRHCFELAPQRSAVPMLIVFEPAVAGTVHEVRVDGAVAELEVRAEGALAVTPVQLPLDGVRTIEVTTGS